jgi:hypothetical protein
MSMHPRPEIGADWRPPPRPRTAPHRYLDAAALRITFTNRVYLFQLESKQLVQPSTLPKHGTLWFEAPPARVVQAKSLGTPLEQ